MKRCLTRVVRENYSGPKLLAKLGMPAITVRAGRDGRLDLRDLRRAVGAHRHRPAVVLATIGTTMAEAVDDVAAIRRVLETRAIRHCYVHADAALSGLPLALLDPGSRPAFDLSDGADSISVSAHKALGCPFPAGIVLTRRSLRNRVDYIGTHNTTIGGSRSGHAPLVLWYAINLHGVDGLRRRFHAARQVAEFAVTQLCAFGWSAWRNPHARTVVMDTPPDPIRAKWRLASSNGQSHLIAVPGITTQQVRAPPQRRNALPCQSRAAPIRWTAKRSRKDRDDDPIARPSSVLTTRSEARERIHQTLLGDPVGRWTVPGLPQQLPGVSAEAVRTTLYLLQRDRFMAEL